MTGPNQEHPPTPTPGEALESLLFATSPYGNVDAIVQHDQRSVYFFLQPRNHEFPARACWVRNLVAGPYVIDQDDLMAGRQVVLPRTYAKSASAGALPRSSDLSVVWFEEGNGAALMESRPGQADQLLAIIPPWSGQEGFHGYAAECAMDSPVCWPLPKNPRLKQRVAAAAKFWSSFLTAPDPFLLLRDQLLEAYRHQLGLDTKPALEQQYYSINADRFPPRGLMEYRLADQTLLMTVAMSLCPQPNVELLAPESQQYRRIELGMKLPSSFDAAKIAQARQRLAQLAGYPWRNFRWLGAGHTCEFPDVFANCNRARLVDRGAPLTVSLSTLKTESVMPDVEQQRVSLLWLEPAS